MDATKLIDQYVKGLGDWRGQKVGELRKVINEAMPELAEDWKWDTPVWTYSGNVCALAAFKDHVKVNFFKGASVPDPKGLFNSGLDAKKSRSIDLHEGDVINKKALQELVRRAAALNKA